MIIFLDTGVLGKITSPSLSIANRQCEEWFYGLLARGVRIVTSDLCDYEIRRGLLVAAKRNREAGGLQNLNDLRLAIDAQKLFLCILRQTRSRNLRYNGKNQVCR